MLLFEEVKWGEGPELVGLSYWVSSPDEPEGFAGDTDVWHKHFGLCFHSGMLYLEDIPDRGSCEGDWINGSDLWMLHALDCARHGEPAGAVCLRQPASYDPTNLHLTELAALAERAEAVAQAVDLGSGFRRARRLIAEAPRADGAASTVDQRVSPLLPTD